MTTPTTTLNEIRQKHPPETGWKALLIHLGKTEPDDEPLPLLTVLKGTNVDDTLWVLTHTGHLDIAIEFAQEVIERTNGPNAKRRSVLDMKDVSQEASPGWNYVLIKAIADRFETHHARPGLAAVMKGLILLELLK